MGKEFERIAIINRGEPAIRFIRAVRQFNREHQTRLQTIVLYTVPDRHARFIREADEAVDIGEATYVDARSGQRKPAYMDHERVARALAECRADAVWVGWGFVSESADFVDLCTRMGLTFIGPDSASMRLLGDKISAKRLAERIGVPVIPWKCQPADTVDAALAHARSIGYPVVLKATAGEGGRGIRRVAAEDELPAAYHSVRNEAQRFFGDPVVFVEKWLQGARHVEVQIIADSSGATWAVGVRDCTLQRRHQKIVEEAPAVILSARRDRALREAAVKICKAARYQNAGTVEFLVEPRTRRFRFMEVNVRLQVEHAVTELTTGLDLVQMQLHIARGGRLKGKPPKPHGHAIEVRLNAEDAEDAFAPAPGRIELLRIPSQPGLRLDSGVSEGDEIPAEFDSMFAKLICCGQTRDAAAAGLTQALEDSAIIVSGGATNRAFLLQLLERDEVKQDKTDVDWLDRQTAAGGHIAAKHADIALIKAAIDAYDAEFEAEREQFFASALRMRPLIRTEAGRSYELHHRGHRYQFRVFKHSKEDYRIDAEGTSIHVEVHPGGRYEHWLNYNGKRFRVLSIMRGLTHLVEVNGTLHKISRDESGNICAHAPSVVVAIDVKPGDQVPAGAQLALLEAMKMEMPIVAPFAGTVREVFVLSNSQVGTGAPLLRLDPAAPAGTEDAQPRVLFSPCETCAVAENDRDASLLLTLGEMRHLMLGADIHPAQAKQLVNDYTRISQLLPPDHRELNRAEDEILGMYVDFSALFRRQAGPEDKEDAGRISPGEYLLTYLRTLDGRGTSLPGSFLEKVRRALRYYGDDSLDPTPELKGLLLLIYKSHQNMEQRVPVITAILERRLACAAALALNAGPEFSLLLERLAAVAKGRFPALSDLAREIRYRYYDLPVFQQARSAAYAEMEDHLAHLLGDTGAGDRAERVQCLVLCPYPLLAMLTARCEGASCAARRLMLEVLTLRFYRMRELEDLRTTEVRGQCLAFAEYDMQGKRVHVVSADTAGLDMARAIEALRSAIAEIPADHDTVVDLYGWSRDPLPDPDAAGIRLGAILNETGFSRPLRRVVIGLAGPGNGGEGEQTQYYTFRPSESGYREERLYRGMHPMISKRLQLWRLENFHIERLPSIEDL
jgi:acetyl/propionyl-CoA carboxylase alpha subunit